MFLIPQDYEAIIRTEILTTITAGKNYNVEAAELTARAEMESYLASRYDVAKILVDVAPWTNGPQFDTGALVWATGALGTQLVFTATAPSAGINPFDPGTGWIPKDPRNQLIRTYLTDMAVYHAHAAIPHKAIPELRVMRYEAAINWLDKVNKGQLTPALPLLPDTADGTPTDGVIRLGSNPKVRHDR